MTILSIPMGLRLWVRLQTHLLYDLGNFVSIHK